MGSACLSLANGIAVLLINPRRRVNRVFFLTSAGAALWATCILGAINAAETGANEALIRWLRASSVIGAFLGWSAWLTRSALLADGQSLINVLLRSWFFFVLSCGGAAIACSEWYIPSTSTRENTERGAGYIAYIFIAGGSCVWMLIDGLRHMSRLEGVRRIEMQFFVLGTSAALLILLAASAFGRLWNLDWLRQMTPLLLIALHITTVWAICYYRVFDAAEIIYSIAHRVLLTLLFLAIVLTTVAVSRFEPTEAGYFAISGIVFLAVSLLDSPSKYWLRLSSAQRLAPPRKKIIEWARSINDERLLHKKFEDLLCAWCQTSDVAMLTIQNSSYVGLRTQIARGWDGWPVVHRAGWITPETLQRKKSSDEANACAEFLKTRKLGAIISVPKGSTAPSLVVTLGVKESLRPYTFPDIQMLLELAELMDNVLMHSRLAAHSARISMMEASIMMSKGLAHDLNNLTTPISTFLIHMQGRFACGSAEAEVLEHAQSCLGVLQNYIRESLFFSTNFGINISSISARYALTEIKSLARDLAESRNVEIRISDFADFFFEGDRALILRLLQNLVLNAIDASPPSRPVELNASACSDFAHFYVADWGQGVAIENAHRIFEPYFTTKSPGVRNRGVGLGLAICRKIADLHGGTIEVVREDNVRTVFIVKLTLKSDSPSNGRVQESRGALR